MTRPGYTHITVVLDRSGSMWNIKEDTIGGFNSLLEEHRQLSGDCTVTLIQFSHHLVVSYRNLPILAASFLDSSNYELDGSTALRDAIGTAIKWTGEDLAAMPENDRPDRVLVAIITDGGENSSQKYTFEQVREMRKHQEEVYNWEFVFIGSDEDGQLEAQNLSLSNRLHFNKAETRQMFDSFSKAAAKYRTAETYEKGTFWEE